MAAVLVCAGCGQRTLARAPRPAVDLSGRWIIDRAASDDAAKIIDDALPKPKRRPDWDPPQDAMMPVGGGQQNDRRGGQRRGSADNQATQTQVVASPPSWARIGPRDFVRAFATPPERLDVAQTPVLVTLAQAGRTRHFEPGDDEPRSITDRFGSRSMRAGWVNDAFVVESTDQSHLDVVEQFRRTGPAQLEATIDFTADRLKHIRIHSVYRPATDAELSAAPDEGPPAPGPR